MPVLFFIPLAFFICLNFTTVFFVKKKFGYCLPFTMIASALAMYFSQMCLHSFRPAFLALLAAGAFGLVVFFIRLIRDRKTAGTYFSTGFWVFIIIFVFYFVVDYGRHFLLFDEFYHWGTMIKESMRLNSFYSVPGSNLWIHKDYPPFMTMFEVLWCKLCRGFSEDRASAAMHVFSMSVLLCAPLERLTEKIKKNPFWKMLHAFMLLIIFLMVILFLDPWSERVATSILVDIVVPILFVYSMLLIYSKAAYTSGFGFACIILSFSALLLTKQAGIIFVLIAELYFLIKVIFEGKVRAGARIRHIIMVLIPIAVARLIQWTWTVYINKLGIEGQFETGAITYSQYLDVFRGKTQGLVHETVNNYFSALFNYPISSVKWLPVTYFAGFVIVIALIIIMAFIFKKTYSVGEAVNTGITLTVGTVAYGAMMAVLYAFFFNEVEMKALASFDRYMSSYLLGEILFLLMVFIDNLSKKTNVFVSIPKLLPVLGCSVLLFDPGNLLYISPQGLREDIREPYRRDADHIAARTAPGDRLFIIYDNNKVSPSWWGAYQAYLQYFLNDRYVSRKKSDAFSYDYSDGTEYDKLMEVMEEYDYLYMRDTNDAINKAFEKDHAYGAMTGNTVYKIVKGSDGISFVKTE